MSPVVEDKAAEWSSLHGTLGSTLPGEKELGVGVESARFLPGALQEGSQSLFLPILPLITSTKPLPALSASISRVPAGREVAEGKPPVEEQMSCGISVGRVLSVCLLLLSFPVLLHGLGSPGNAQSHRLSPVPVSDLALSLCSNKNSLCVGLVPSQLCHLLRLLEVSLSKP